MHGIDIEAELTRAVGQEIAGEIVNEVIADLLRLGTATDISELNLVKNADADESDSAVRLTMEINKAASNIAFKTRRGAGNFAIVPSHVISILQSMKNGYFKPVALPDGTFVVGQLIHAGDLGSIKVYASISVGDQIIVGYKGEGNEIDAGYFLAPYIPALSAGVTTNPITSQPLLRFLTRYGKALNKDRETAQEYYRVLKLDTIERTPVPEDLVSDNA